MEFQPNNNQLNSNNQPSKQRKKQTNSQKRWQPKNKANLNNQPQSNFNTQQTNLNQIQPNNPQVNSNTQIYAKPVYDDFIFGSGGVMDDNETLKTSVESLRKENEVNEVKSENSLRVNTFEIELNNIKNDMINIKNDMINIKNDMNDIKNDMITIKNDMNNIENFINNIKNDMKQRQAIRKIERGVMMALEADEDLWPSLTDLAMDLRFNDNVALAFVKANKHPLASKPLLQSISSVLGNLKESGYSSSQPSSFEWASVWQMVKEKGKARDPNSIIWQPFLDFIQKEKENIEAILEV